MRQNQITRWAWWGRTSTEEMAKLVELLQVELGPKDCEPAMFCGRQMYLREGPVDCR